jgi:adenylate cyclase
MSRFLRYRWLLLGSIAGWATSLGVLCLIHRVEMPSATGWDPDPETMLKLWAVASALFGAVFTFITILGDSTRLRSQPYGMLILVKSFAMLLTLLCYVLFRMTMEVVAGDSTPSQAWEHGVGILLSPLMRVAVLYVWITAVALNFVRQMSAMVGPRILANLLLGKYRLPKVETRVFMFVDLEGSTSIAERLGHALFCQLIQECFRDLGEVAIQRGAEIYQYVGDEAILTWNPSRGLRDCNCLRLFFDFQIALRRRDQFYRERFGLTPEFKAGANIGPATVAEVGVVKRDIAYLSDVLNTASRLQSMCREFQASLLITDSLNQALPETICLRRERVGNVILRGKSREVEIYCVEARHSERGECPAAMD